MQSRGTRFPFFHEVEEIQSIEKRKRSIKRLNEENSRKELMDKRYTSLLEVILINYEWKEWF